MHFFYLVEDQNEQKLADTIGNKHSIFKKNLSKGVQEISCTIARRDIRFIAREVKDYFIMVSTYSELCRDEQLKAYFTALVAFLPEVSDPKKIGSNFKKLRHNLVNHNTQILQDLMSAYPELQNYSNAEGQRNYIKSQMVKRPEEISQNVLRVQKFAKMIKSEMDTFELINSEHPSISFSQHQLHKVILLSSNPYLMDLKEKGINLTISPSSAKIDADYTSLTVIFSHIFDNAVKYCLKNTKLNVSVKANSDSVYVDFTMTSMRIYNDDLLMISKEGHRGRTQKNHKIKGSGLGLYIVTKLLELNHGYMTIDTNLRPLSNTSYDDVEFEENSFKIYFRD